MNHKEFLKCLNENLLTKSANDVKDDEFISDVASGQVKFLTVVESLQDVLTNENVSIRERGIEFLSRVLASVPNDLFNAPEISVIVNFYCDCLKGHHNLLPATVKGLLAIVNMKNIQRENLQSVLTHLFQHVNCSTQLQSDRFNIYSILKSVLVNNLEDVRSMGPDLVFGIISFIEGETDPKCLLAIFSFLPLFILQYDLGHLSEELFELLACYFPIDFNSAVKDNTLITREDLSEGLLECLSANESFCENCLPLVFEKLTSTLKVAKVDSYSLLKACCRKLNPNCLKNYLTEFWKCVQKDVLPGSDKELCDVALSALTDFVGLLSRDECHGDMLVTFLGSIIDGVNSLASRVDENMFQPAIRILIAASVRSSTATGKVMVFLKPFYHIVDSNAPKELKIILSTLLPFLDVCCEHRMANSENPPEQRECYGHLVNLYMKSATFEDNEVRRLAFLGIFKLMNDLTDESRNNLLIIVLDNVKTREDVKTSVEFLSIFRHLAECHPMELRSKLSTEIEIVPDRVDHTTGCSLWALSFLADLPHFTEFVVPLILDFIVRSPQQYLIGLESLLNACRFSKKKNSHSFYQKIQNEQNVLERLVDWWNKSTSEGALIDVKSLLVLSEVIAFVTRQQSTSEQQQVVEKFVGTFLNHIAGGDGSTSLTTCHSVALLEAVLGSVRPEVKVLNLTAIKDKLLLASLRSTDDLTRLTSSRLLASLINKSDENLAGELLSGVVNEIFRNVDQASSPVANCGLLFTWLMKSVVLRGGPCFDEWMSKWFNLLGREGVGSVLAENFQMIFERDELFLNFESHCNVRILYRQRLFGYFSKLLEMYEKADDSVKANYLLALAGLLKGMPYHVIQTEIANVALLLTKCLNTDKPDVLLTALEILMELLEKREKVLSDNINSFVPKILSLSTFEGVMDIRVKALKCLFFYGFYPTFILLPLKNKVIQDLGICLDDKKRLVRREAVKARCRWFLVGAPGEDVLQS